MTLNRLTIVFGDALFREGRISCLSLYSCFSPFPHFQISPFKPENIVPVPLFPLGVAE